MLNTWSSTGKIALRLSAAAFPLPGRLTIREFVRTPAMPRDKLALGATRKHSLLISSCMSGTALSITVIAASGVTSQRASPEPPQVIIRFVFNSSAQRLSSALMRSMSFGSIAV
ncbi:MAG: hypothetical protein PUK45_01675 [Clostridia bacterium]|nr:hypothetical protein [Clostridia bacterium]